LSRDADSIAGRDDPDTIDHFGGGLSGGTRSFPREIPDSTAYCIDFRGGKRVQSWNASTHSDVIVRLTRLIRLEAWQRLAE
jgi:hypothetical protein